MLVCSKNHEMPVTVSVNQLSPGVQGDDVARVHQTIQAPAGMFAPPKPPLLFGSATAAVLNALRAHFGLPATGGAINTKISEHNLFSALVMQERIKSRGGTR
jgi:hypothetical protein